MKRWMIVAILVAALVAVITGTALAQTATPTTPPATGVCPIGMTPGMGAHGPMMGGRMGGMPEWAGLPESVETLLGMTAAEIQAERQAGKSLAEIAQAKNVTVEALVQAILDDHKADLAQLVADGKLTQAQADAMLARMQTQVRAMVERTGAGPMMGQGQRPGMGQGQQNVPPAGFRGRGGMRGGGGMMGGVQG